MVERERPDPQSDIEFDFFDESPTVEGGEREGTPPRRRRKMPTRPPGGPSPSFVRLALLIAGAILLAVVLVLVVNNCRGNQKKAKYQDYMEAVNGPATESAQVGKELNDALTTPGIKLADLARKSRVSCSSSPRSSPTRAGSTLPARCATSSRALSRRCSSVSTA